MLANRPARGEATDPNHTSFACSARADLEQSAHVPRSDEGDALSGRGVFRRFRDVIHRRGLKDEWEAFRAKRLADLIRFRLKENGIPFRK